MKQPDNIPNNSLFRVLIPVEPRRFPGQRWVKITARALHVVCSGIFLGAYVFQVDPEIREPWFAATLLSGLLMLLLDLYESGAFLLQMRGLVVMLKLVLVACLPRLGDSAVWVLVAVASISVISSHAPSSFRYFLIFGRGRIEGAKTKG